MKGFASFVFLTILFVLFLDVSAKIMNNKLKVHLGEKMETELTVTCSDLNVSVDLSSTISKSQKYGAICCPELNVNKQKYRWICDSDCEKRKCLLVESNTLNANKLQCNPGNGAQAAPCYFA